MSITSGDIPSNIPLQVHEVMRVNSTDDGFEPKAIDDYSQSSPSRSLNSNFIPSSVRNAAVSYSVEVTTSLSLTGGASGTVFLEISADGSTGWTELARYTNANTGTLTIGLALAQTGTANLAGTVPVGYTARLRTANNTGTPTFTYRSGQETLIG